MLLTSLAPFSLFSLPERFQTLDFLVWFSNFSFLVSFFSLLSFVCMWRHTYFLNCTSPVFNNQEFIFVVVL